MNARKIHHVQVYIKEKISVGSNSSANNVTDAKSSHMSCSSSDESDTEQETRSTAAAAAAAVTGQVINNPTSQPKNTTVTTVTVTPPLISVSQPQMTTIKQSQIPQPLSQPAAPLSQAQIPLGKVAVPPTQPQMASSGLTQQPQISSLVPPSNLPLNQGGMSSLTQQPQVLNIQSQVPITQNQHSQQSIIHQPLLSMGPLPVTQSSSVPSTNVKVEDDSIESVLQDLFAHEPKKPKIEEMAASSNTQVANQIAQLGGNPPITIKTEMGQFPTGVAAPTTKQESFKLPDLFFSSQDNKPIHLTQSVEPGRKNAELLTPPINLNPRPSILPLNLPNIILPKEPTRDLPTTMITTQVRPKIVWNEQVADPTPPPPPPCTVTKPVTTVTPSTTQGPSALSHLKEYRINRTPSKHGSTGLPSFTEPDDPSKPVSLISQGGGHFKCSRCNVGFKDIAIPDARNPMGSPGDPGKTNNNNSVVVKHCLNVHGTKAMLFR